jgi:putative ABC transport system ATP-binding protein
MIEIQNITVQFEEKQVFNNFSVDIIENQHVCFAGTSGRGKSTILKLIQAYVVPEKGRVIVNGLELTPENVSKVRALIAYIPQNVNLPVENGLELIKMLGIEDKREKVKTLLNDLGLNNEYYTRKFDQMSGGEKQRVVIAVCFALERKIVLMDEPTSSLDSDSANKVLQLIKKMSDTSFVSASHNQEWIKSADKTVNL